MDEFNKQNVLIVHNYYQIPGGEDTVVANEKKLLEDHGHNVILYTRDNGELKKMGKLRKLFLPFTTIYNPRTARDIKRIIKERNVDIVHVHNTLNLISPSVYYASRKCGVPVVQTIHNFRLLCPGATFYRDGHICEDCVKHGLRCAVKHSCYRGSKVQTLACVISTSLHRMTGIYGKINYICLTEFTKQKMVQLKQIQEKKIFIKPNFTINMVGKGLSGDYYLFVGRVEKIKGIEKLVDAFKLMPKRKLVIAGSGELDVKIKSRVNEEKIDNIELLGFQSRASVTQLMSNAKALIMCSQWYETFGMVIIEAYSNGTPAIVGNIGNIKDLVKAGETGELFEYDSVESLIQAVERFERNSEVLYRKNAYDFYIKGYEPNNNYKQLKLIYDHIVEAMEG